MNSDVGKWARNYVKYQTSKVTTDKAHKITNQWLWIRRFGVPWSIVSDQGTQFEPMLFKELSQLLEIQKKRTTAYNPKSNGMI